jgi:uncharacterized BrkB/YihY/UPF0761 family membrane protein
MATYSAALAYRGLFPFVLILVVLVGALGFPDFFDRAMEQAQSQSSSYVPHTLEPVVQRVCSSTSTCALRWCYLVRN